MVEQPRSGALRDTSQTIPPVGDRSGQVAFAAGSAVDRVHHQLEQLVAPGDVAVEGRRSGIQIGRETAHGQGLEAVTVGERDRSVDDAIELTTRTRGQRREAEPDHLRPRRLSVGLLVGRTRRRSIPGSAVVVGSDRHRLSIPAPHSPSTIEATRD